VRVYGRKAAWSFHAFIIGNGMDEKPKVCGFSDPIETRRSCMWEELSLYLQPIS
jgi:hypothetical protein